MRDHSRRTRRSRLGRWATVALVALALPLAACDDEDDDDNGTGPDPATARVEMTDSEDGSAAIGADEARIAVASGTFSADAEATLIGGAGTDDADLGDPVAVTVNLQTGTAAVVFTGVEIPAGTYAGAQATLTGAAVVVDSGSTIGVGPIDVIAETTIAVENDEDVVIEGDFAAPVEVAGGGQITVLVDLNSAVWLDAAVVAAGATEGTVLASEIEAAATVTAESGGF